MPQTAKNKSHPTRPNGKGKPMTATATPPAQGRAKRAKNPALANETPQQKFRRLANNRIPKALSRLKQVGNLKAYGYDESQVKVIDSLLTEAVGRAIANLEDGLTSGRKDGAKPEVKPIF